MFLAVSFAVIDIVAEIVINVCVFELKHCCPLSSVTDMMMILSAHIHRCMCPRLSLALASNKISLLCSSPRWLVRLYHSHSLVLPVPI